MTCFKHIGLCLFVFKLAFLSPPINRQLSECLSCATVRPTWEWGWSGFLFLSFDFHVSLVAFLSRLPGLH